MKNNNYFNSLFPVTGGVTAGTGSGIAQAKATMLSFSDCFTWIDLSFIGNVAISALVDGVVGYLVSFGLDKVFKKGKVGLLFF